MTHDGFARFSTCRPSVSPDDEWVLVGPEPSASSSDPQPQAQDPGAADHVEGSNDKMTDLGDCLEAVDSVKAQYMHGDLYSPLAVHNPMRWSYLKSVEEVAEELDQQPRKRKLLLRVVSSKQRLHKMFQSAAGAAAWIRKRLVRSKDAAELDEERLCIICLTQPRNVLLMPCRHAVLCEECLGILMERRPSQCPVCRSLWEQFRLALHLANLIVDTSPCFPVSDYMIWVCKEAHSEPCARPLPRGLRRACSSC